MSRKSLRNTKRALLIVALVALLIMAVYLALYANEADSVHDNMVVQPDVRESLDVLVIDVGQGDSILVTFDSGDTMLIDAGTKSAAKTVSEQLDERGITSIDVLVATHPHADHIGGMQSIIERYEIGQIYMPAITSTSKTYRDFINAIEKRGIPVTIAHAGLEFALGPAVCTVVSPQKGSGGDANNESVVIFLDYGETDFLFTGDMEAWAEAAVLEAGYHIDAEVLKVAHHGSRSSTTETFLLEVSPSYAVISCGDGNRYRHPHDETLALLDKYSITTLRTDLLGHILFVADGQELSYSYGN